MAFLKKLVHHFSSPYNRLLFRPFNAFSTPSSSSVLAHFSALASLQPANVCALIPGAYSVNLLPGAVAKHMPLLQTNSTQSGVSWLQICRAKYKWTYEGLSQTRNYFQRPSEVKRLRKSGWHARLATRSGRRILMRRILKGRHVLSH